MDWRHRDELILAGKVIGATLVALMPCLVYPFNKYISCALAYICFNLVYTLGYKRIASALGIDERAARVARIGVCVMAFLILVSSFFHLGMSRG